MSNAIRITRGIDPSIALMELGRNAKLWELETFRQDFSGSPHLHTKSIFCRVTDEFKARDPEQVVGAHMLEASDFHAYESLPSVYGLVSGLMKRVNGERIGCVMVVKLAAGKSIEAHIDEGEYPKYYDRFHIALSGGANGALYRIGDKKFRMLPGEVWWFQNLIEHEVFNDSNEDRINIIVDIKLKGIKPCP